ncbi:uncharacterized protein LOC144101415 isoform X2 [Amblyomma americanum]
MRTTLQFSFLPLLVIAALVPAGEAKLEEVKRACVEVEVVADKCARKHYRSYKLDPTKTQPFVKKCFSNRAHVTDLMLDCAEPMALGIFITCSVDAVADTTGQKAQDPEFKTKTRKYKECVERNLQGTVKAETDPYEFDKKRRKIGRRLAEPAPDEGLFNNVFTRYVHVSEFHSLPPDRVSKACLHTLDVRGEQGIRRTPRKWEFMYSTDRSCSGIRWWVTYTLNT